jgi:penicillin-insensitive murein endopeptidase
VGTFVKKNKRILSGGFFGLISSAFLSANAHSARAVSTVAHAAAVIPNITWFPDTRPDVEESVGESNEEDSGLQMERSFNIPFVSPDQNPVDATQGTVDQAHGFYSKGSLANASQFPLENEDLMKIMRPRDRGYATFDMTAVVGFAAGELHKAYPDGERIQIGDVCAVHGGQLAQHASHQNGLDADIVYPRVNHREQDPAISTGFDELFVKDGQISPNFDQERVWFFIKSLVSTGRVVRMFMDPVIKATLCQYAQSIGEYDSGTEILRRMRPLVDHQNHVHVRITCPKESPQCLAQVPVPPGSGCDEVSGIRFN